MGTQKKPKGKAGAGDSDRVKAVKAAKKARLAAKAAAKAEAKSRRAGRRIMNQVKNRAKRMRSSLCYYLAKNPGATIEKYVLEVCHARNGLDVVAYLTKWYNKSGVNRLEGIYARATARQARRNERRAARGVVFA